jgi:hypothetical protein
MTLQSPQGPTTLLEPERVDSSGLLKLAQLHVELATADEEWRGATAAARRVTVLLDRIAEFWRDLPQVREPVMKAAGRANLQIKIIIAACAYDKTLNHSWALRTLLRDILDDVCVVIATYLEGFNDD